MRELETDCKEGMIYFNRLAKAGKGIFVFLWPSVKISIINEQTGEETICKTWTPQLYVFGIGLPEFFSIYVIFLFNNKKKPST